MLHINIFASALQGLLDVLDRPAGDDHDLIAAAITSSQLERALSMVEEQKEVIPSVQLPTYFHHKKLLARCNNTLEKRPLSVSTLALTSRFAVAVERLQALPAHVFTDDEIQEGKDALLNFDAVISLAVVACRHGWIEEKELNALATQASEEVWDSAANLSNLWEYAENRELMFAPAPDYPEAFSFWEELAQLSITRLNLNEAMTLRTEDEKDAIIKRVLDALTS